MTREELTWQDIAEIIVAYGYVPKLNKDGSVRPWEDVFKDTLEKWDGERGGKMEKEA